MKKTSILFLCIIALVAFAAWAPNADANPSTSSCVGCHNFGSSGSTIHQGHLGLGLSQDCLTCHNSTPGDTPDTPNCGICHTQPGTPLHHQNAGAASCVSCHSGNPAPEDTAVEGYGLINASLDPCDGSEERFGSRTVSLDNDGDDLYDMNDPDCAPQGPVCGDGNQDPGEECDDGNTNPGDGCAADCTIEPFCGDGTRDPGEACDDGNNANGDGCSAACATEPFCGDGIVNGTEQCDGTTGCAANCTLEPTTTPPSCGDGIVNGTEQCDGTADCAADCTLLPFCGDGVVDPGEECDDNNNRNGDGCTADCVIEDPVTTPPTGGGDIPMPANHDDEEEDVLHARDKDEPFSSGCTACHGSDLTGGIAPSCFTCHGQEWDEEMPNVPDFDVHLTPRFRLYNPYTFHHHYTTDVNEYNVLGTIGWVQESTGCYFYNGYYVIDAAETVPYYRLYNPNSFEHHWTTDANEYHVLGTIGWIQEGADGYVFASQVSDSEPLYRLYNPNDGLHHWTMDTNERNVLIGFGFIDEGIACYVFPW